MPQNYVNRLTGFRTQSQIRLNAKEDVASEVVLKDLGLNDNLAFVYEKGLIVYCKLEGTRYEWKEVPVGEELTGLRPTDYVYPAGVITDDVIYSNKKYNFFKIDGSLPLATTVKAGLLSPDDKIKLNNTSNINSGDQDLSKVIQSNLPFTKLNALIRVDAEGRLVKQSLVEVTDIGDLNIPEGRNYLVNGAPLESDKTFRYSQTSPYTIWNINHNLNKYPSVIITDSAGNEYESEFIYNDLNNVTITFNNPFSGHANFN